MMMMMIRNVNWFRHTFVYEYKWP